MAGGSGLADVVAQLGRDGAPFDALADPEAHAKILIDPLSPASGRA